MKEQEVKTTPPTELVTHNGFRNQDEIVSKLYAKGILSTGQLTKFLQGEETTIELEGDDQLPIVPSNRS